MEPAQALAELVEISSQIAGAVLVDAEGGVLAATLADEEAARRLAEGAVRLLDEAASAPGGRPDVELLQLEVSTVEGSVFVVRDGDRTVAAVTAPEPTVGLVLYDLKSCLRSLDTPAEEPDARSRRSRRKAEKGAESDPS
jgi:predicted regulator of Ras-like GTPase activity (Roadblock/LC7/MglB family)